jgi:hypothetical protein
MLAASPVRNLQLRPEDAMSGSARIALTVVFLVSLSAGVSLAQSSSAPKTGSPHATTPLNRNTTHQEPCWKQAGISQSAMQQRHEIAQSTRSEIEAVCRDSSLTAQQKHEKIHQIRSEEHARMQGLISSGEMESLEKCRAARGMTPHAGGHQEDPCAAESSQPQEESPEH